MKRSVSFLLVAVMACIAITTPALAADEAPYPAEITEYTEGNHPRLNKVYLFSADDDPALIPTADFERDNNIYTLLDLTQQDLTETKTKTCMETVTVESKSKDMGEILPLLPTTRETVTEDGYSGVLTLDTGSIKVEAADYGTSSRTVTATRSYPNLSDADTAFVPKTIEENGWTLELADVQWQEAGGFYHAVATYTGTATSRYVKGYTVTADYTGEVTKVTNDKIAYTAIFGGEPIKRPIWMVMDSWLIVPLGIAAAGMGTLLVLGGKKLKARKEARKK